MWELARGTYPRLSKVLEEVYRAAEENKTVLGGSGSTTVEVVVDKPSVAEKGKASVEVRKAKA